MFELKPISRQAVPEAIQKAERYRLLNEPWQAESICQDVLGIEPDHQAALVMLLLSLTDQFGKGVSAAARRAMFCRESTANMNAPITPESSASDGPERCFVRARPAPDSPHISPCGKR